MKQRLILGLPWETLMTDQLNPLLNPMELLLAETVALFLIVILLIAVAKGDN